MKLHGVNHLAFSVTDLEKSIDFYSQVFDAKLMLKGERLAYLDLEGHWIVLNLQERIPRNEITHSYTHAAFTVDDAVFDQMLEKLDGLGLVELLEGRPRDEREGRSLYFIDPDGHKFEFHTGNLYDRLEYYKETRKDFDYFD